MEGTAVADAPVTAATPAETASQPEASQVTATETRERTDTTDSVTDGTSEESPVLSKEEHEKALKALEARLNESHRQKELSARKEAEDKARKDSFEQRGRAAAQARQGLAVRELEQMLQQVHKRASEGEDFAFDQRRFAGLVGMLDNMSFHDLHEQYSEEQDIILEQEYPDFAVPRELATGLERATKAYDRAGMVRARHAIYRAAILSDLTPKLRKEVLAELAKTDTEAAKEAALEGAEETRTGAQRPTKIAGGPAPVRTPQQILDDPNASTGDRAVALEKLTGFKIKH